MLGEWRLLARKRLINSQPTRPIFLELWWQVFHLLAYITCDSSKGSKKIVFIHTHNRNSHVDPPLNNSIISLMLKIFANVLAHALSFLYCIRETWTFWSVPLNRWLAPRPADSSNTPTKAALARLPEASILCAHIHWSRVASPAPGTSWKPQHTIIWWLYYARHHYCWWDTYSVAAFSKRKLNVGVKDLPSRKHIESLSSPYTNTSGHNNNCTACRKSLRSSPSTLFDQIGKLVSGQSRIDACKIVQKVKQLPHIAKSWHCSLTFPSISLSARQHYLPA